MESKQSQPVAVKEAGFPWVTSPEGSRYSKSSGLGNTPSLELYTEWFNKIKMSNTCHWSDCESLYYFRDERTLNYISRQTPDSFGWVYNELGAHYYFLTKDHERAFGCFSAHYYFLTKDHERAFGCFSKAAEQQNFCALLNLAKMYYDGDGCQRNLESSIEYAEKSFALQSNFAPAYLFLARMYLAEPRLCKKKGYEYAFKLYDLSPSVTLLGTLSRKDNFDQKVLALKELTKESNDIVPFALFALGYLMKGMDDVCAAQSFFKAYSLGFKQAFIISRLILTIASFSEY